MADHQRDWIAILEQAKGRRTAYLNVQTSNLNKIDQVIGSLGFQGEATDQLTNVGTDLMLAARGSHATGDVTQMALQASREHQRAITLLTTAKKAINDAEGWMDRIITRIEDAQGDISGV